MLILVEINEKSSLNGRLQYDLMMHRDCGLIFGPPCIRLFYFSHFVLHTLKTTCMNTYFPNDGQKAMKTRYVTLYCAYYLYSLVMGFV